MDVCTVGSALSPAALRLLEKHGFHHTDGAAEAFATVVDDRLVLSLPLTSAPDEHRPSRGAGIAALLGFARLRYPEVIAASAGSLAATAAAEQRRRQGQRTGPRPAKPRRETAERIADLRAAGASYRDIAKTLTAEGVPSPGGNPRWHATTVKRVTDAGIAETRLVLRRLGGLLADVKAAGEVSEEQLAALGSEHRFHHHRLLRAFEEGVGAPYVGRFVPSLRRVDGRFALSERGAALLALWERSEELDDRLEDMLLEWSASSPGQLDQIAAGRRWDAELLDEALRLGFVRRTRQRLSLTKRGLEVAETWRRVVDPDPRERLDIDFWPEPHEERRLPPTWDWEDDPLPLSGRN
jgi:hypothetical protein